MGEKSPLVLWVAITIVCSLLQHLWSPYARRTEVFSEAGCWLLLLAVIRGRRYFRPLPKVDREKCSGYNISQHFSLCLIAAGIAISCLCKAESEVDWIKVSKPHSLFGAGFV